MDRSEFIELGYIVRAHGIKGEVRAAFDVYDLAFYKKKKTLYLTEKEGPLTPFAVKSFSLQTDSQAIIQFEGIEDRTAAEGLIGRVIWIPETQLPPLPKGEFYYFQVIGYAVMDRNLGPIGKVKGFQDGVAQDVLVIDYQEKEVLVPITPDFVLDADHEARVLNTALPEGLLELYIE